jgi:hypothetical protein
MTGILGKRTKFQQEHIAQLAVHASSKLDPVKETSKPQEAELNDDQLLNKIKFVEDRFESRLIAMDQCILLSLW